MTTTRSSSICGALIDNEKTDKADRDQGTDRAGRRPMAARTRSTAPSPTMTSCCSSIRRWPISSTRAANSGARRATGPRRWPISAPRSSSTPTTGAKANYKSLAQELERLGALKAVAGKPSFNCATRPARGGKGDLRQSRARRSRPRDQCVNIRVIGEAQKPARSPRAAARAGRVHRPPQCRVRPAGLRPAKGHEASGCRSCGVDGY